MIYSCAEHFERALDDFVLQFESAPDIMCADNEQKCGGMPTLICHYCDKKAMFVFQKPEPEILASEENDS